MVKRILAIVISAAMAVGILTGCSFFSHDNERDLQQVVATVSAYKISNTYIDDNGVSTEHSITTTEKTVYKRDLLEYVQNNQSSLSSSFSNDPEGLYKYAIRMLINIEIVTNEVDALIASKQVKWGIAEKNAVKKGVYSVIDNSLLSIKNTILEERDQEKIISPDADSSSTDTSTEKKTTYPTKPEQTSNDDEDARDPEPWTPNVISKPGLNGDSETRSLEREAMRRFIALIKSRAASDFRLDRPERKWLKTKIDAEIKAIDKVIDTNGIEYVYDVIGEYNYPMSESTSEFGYLMYYASGESLERSQKISAMQKYLVDGITVQYDEVAKSYATQLNEQKSKYGANIEAYDTDISDGSATILYHANSNYFYVKHILLPFSDEQKNALTAFKERADISNLQKDEQTNRINEYRARLADAIVCYPHKDGEDDKTRPMSVDDVLAHIRSVMTPLAGNVKSANDAFNDLIYLYNTDPGAFNNDKGYVVKYENAEGESEKYMQEFADGARYMRRNLEVGQFYDEKVITDYGVHIMYLASIPERGEVKLDAYTTQDRSQTYYDLIEEPIRTARENAAFTDWQNNILNYNYNTRSKTYFERFSDLWSK